MMRLAEAGLSLDEATTGLRVAALTLPALRVWEYMVTGDWGGCAAAQVGTAAWLRRRLPALRLRLVLADAVDTAPHLPY